MFHPATIRAAKQHDVTIVNQIQPLSLSSGIIIACNKCGQRWSPMLQAGGKLPRQWWKCPRGWECN